MATDIVTNRTIFQHTYDYCNEKFVTKLGNNEACLVKTFKIEDADNVIIKILKLAGGIILGGIALIFQSIWCWTSSSTESTSSAVTTLLSEDASNTISKTTTAATSLTSTTSPLPRSRTPSPTLSDGSDEKPLFGLLRNGSFDANKFVDDLTPEQHLAYRTMVANIKPDTINKEAIVDAKLASSLDQALNKLTSREKALVLTSLCRLNVERLTGENFIREARIVWQKTKEEDIDHYISGSPNDNKTSEEDLCYEALKGFVNTNFPSYAPLEKKQITDSLYKDFSNSK